MSDKFSIELNMRSGSRWHFVVTLETLKRLNYENSCSSVDEYLYRLFNTTPAQWLRIDTGGRIRRYRSADIESYEVRPA